MPRVDPDYNERDTGNTLVMTAVDPLTAFADALSAEMTRAGLNQTELGTKADVSQGLISAWLRRTTANPEPAKVFAVEAALKLAPGFLSRHLGYVPVSDEAGPVVDVRYAVENDPDLDPLDRKAVLLLYNVFRERRA